MKTATLRIRAVSRGLKPVARRALGSSTTTSFREPISQHGPTRLRHTVDSECNGELMDNAFGPSPSLATDRTICELCLPSERGMEMHMNLADPVSSGKYDGT